MTRKAYISSAFSTDEQVARVAHESTLKAFMFLLLLTDLDDWGRGEASARSLKLRVYPAFEDVTEDVIEEALQLYAEVGWIILYEDTTKKGKRYMAVEPAKWYRYQTQVPIPKRTHAHDSRYPMPPQFASFYEQSSEEEDDEGHEGGR